MKHRFDTFFEATERLALPVQNKKIPFTEAYKILSQYFEVLKVYGEKVRNIKYGGRSKGLDLNDIILWLTKHVNPTAHLKKYQMYYLIKMDPKRDYIPTLDINSIITKATTKKMAPYFYRRRNRKIN